MRALLVMITLILPACVDCGEHLPALAKDLELYRANVQPKDGLSEDERTATHALGVALQDHLNELAHDAAQ